MSKKSNYDWRDKSAYEVWRRGVLYKYNYKCGITGKSGRLCCHHIQGGATNKKVRYSINNGIALLPEIHRAYHRWWGYSKTATATSFELFKLLFSNRCFYEASGEYFIKYEFRKIRLFDDI